MARTGLGGLHSGRGGAALDADLRALDAAIAQLEGGRLGASPADPGHTLDADAVPSPSPAAGRPLYE